MRLNVENGDYIRVRKYNHFIARFEIYLRVLINLTSEASRVEVVLYVSQGLFMT